MQILEDESTRLFIIFCYNYSRNNRSQEESMSKTVIKNASVFGKICNVVCENGVIVSINREKGLSGYDADGRQSYTPLYVKTLA